MKLTQLTGENETKDFINECIKTTLKNWKKIFANNLLRNSCNTSWYFCT
jgi:hypothetical protein